MCSIKLILFYFVYNIFLNNIWILCEMFALFPKITQWYMTMFYTEPHSYNISLYMGDMNVPTACL